MDSKPWYENGLRFRCARCGSCCTGEPGYVWVTLAEIEALAAELGEADVSEFERKYVRAIGIRRSLRELANGDCVFFDAARRQCLVYGARPRQCRSWPFWDSNLRTLEDWRRTCEQCPGSGRGRTHGADEINRKRQMINV